MAIESFAIGNALGNVAKAIFMKMTKIKSYVMR